MKENIKKILNILLFSFVVVVVITFFYVGGNFIIWTMFVAGVVATGIFAYFFKKSKPVYILFYAIALISIYLIGAYLYTSPFLVINCPLFMTNHFHIIDITTNKTALFALYNGTYWVPYNLSLYEPTYIMFPFQTKVPNLINQTIIIKLSSSGLSKNYIIEAKYKVINESIISDFEKYYTQTYHYASNKYSTPVYILILKPEIPNPKIINWNNFTIATPQFLNYSKHLTSIVVSAEYNGITIT